MFAEDAKYPLAGVADSANSVTVAAISDATVVGRNILKATDAATARTAIGAGTGSSNLAVGSTIGSALASAGAAGSSTQAARADHVHPYPTAANVGAAPTSHTHTVANVTGLQGLLDAKLTATKAVAVADSTATDVDGLNVVVNALLANLRAAGILAST